MCHNHKQQEDGRFYFALGVYLRSPQFRHGASTCFGQSARHTCGAPRNTGTQGNLHPLPSNKLPLSIEQAPALQRNPGVLNLWESVSVAASANSFLREGETVFGEFLSSGGRHELSRRTERKKGGSFGCQSGSAPQSTQRAASLVTFGIVWPSSTFSGQIWPLFYRSLIRGSLAGRAEVSALFSG